MRGAGVSRAEAIAGTGSGRKARADEGSERLSLLSRLAFSVFGAMMLGFAAQVAIPLWPYGLPQSLQTLAVLLIAIGLGPKLGSLSLVIYLGVGALGAGVFAEGEAGVAVLFGQTAGYLLGFLLCQPLVARIVRRRDGSVRGWLALVLAGVAAHGLIYALGVPWLYFLRNMDPNLDPITWRNAILYGMVAFLPWDAAKTALAVVIGRWMLPRAMRRVW